MYVEDKESKKSLYLLILIISITFLCYLKVIRYDIINFDDPNYVFRNTHLFQFSPKNIRWALTATDPDYWHPLVWISYMLDFQLYGDSAWGFHLSNLIYHIISACLLFLFLKRATKSPFKSAIISLIFAIHPLHVESVAWISERKDVLSGIFFHLGLILYLRYVKSQDLLNYTHLLLCLTLALMTKPSTIIFPIILMLLDIWPFKRLKKPHFNKILYEKIPIIILSMLSIFLVIYLKRDAEIVIKTNIIPLSLRVKNALISYIIYISKAIIPCDLSIFYPYPKDIALLPTLISLLILLLISFGVLMLIDRYSYLFTGWMWFIIGILPASGIFQWGLWPSMADRFTYIPLTGLSIMMVWGIHEILERFKVPDRVFVPLVISYLSYLIYVCTIQIGFWKDTKTLFMHAIEVNPDNYVAHFMIAMQYGAEGDTIEAMKHYNKAVLINPSYIAFMHNRVGYELMQVPMISEAIAQFRAAITLCPEYAVAMNNLAVALARQHRFREAIEYLRKAIKLDPTLVEAKRNILNIEKDMERLSYR